jgi:L-aspartate oxidase
MMTATQVFGKRAGEFAARRVARLNAFPSSISGSEETGQHNSFQMAADAIQFLADTAAKVRRAMGKYAMVLRCEKGLKACKSILNDCDRQLNELKSSELNNIEQYFKVSNMIVTANLVVESALQRGDSLGSHYRYEFPQPPYALN